MSATASASTPNPLVEREPELVHRLAAVRSRVNDMLLDKLAAAQFADPAFRLRQCPYPLAEVRAVAQVLRVLTRPRLDEDDLAIFDACWRQTMLSDLFANRFEPERHRIQQCVEEGRHALLSREHACG